jgi:quinol-cytochrome oxidoreductase complex cytochrome b subunit
VAVVRPLGRPPPRQPEPRPARRGGTVQPVDEPLKPFFPHYILDEVIAWFVVLAGLVVLASVLPAGLEDEADPLVTPQHVKPEWYFLSVYQLLKIVPRTIGIVAPLVAVGILLLLPFLDRNPAVAKRRRPLALSAGVLAVIGIVALTIWGAQS